MKSSATKGKKASESNAKSHGAVTYQKVMDNRKRPIRGLWKRGSRYYAQLSVQHPTTGQKFVKRTPLIDPETKEPVRTVAKAVEALNRLKIQRKDNDLPTLSRTPKFKDYVASYLDHFRAVKAKKASTIAKERSSLDLWIEHLNETRLDRITKPMLTSFMAKRAKAGIKNRTINLDLISLRNVLKMAVDDGWLKSLPTANLKPLKTSPKKRQLFSTSDLEMLCNGAMECCKNGRQFCDYVRLLAYSGARRNEALALKWVDVDWDRKQLTIGAEGTAKNRKFRMVDFNPALENHLKDMSSRRDPNTDWMFPSAQRGERDVHAMTFKQALWTARAKAGLGNVTFHDLRHHFISVAVMARIDYMTIARWVGHQDGGVLIGKVYGHLSDEHSRRMAEQLRFGPVVMKSPDKSESIYTEEKTNE